MKKISLTIIAAFLGLMSCQNKNSAATEVNQTVVVPFTQQTSVNTNSSANSSKHNLFGTKNTEVTNTVAVGVNPAHGQPNHRCDIAVGAPLNSAANTATKGSVTQPSAAANNTTTDSNLVAGVNPAHGLEGHRCDIAVGAPLP